MKKPFQTRYQEKLDRFAEAYDLSSINSANDEANLRALITNDILIEDLQMQLQDVSDSDEPDPDQIEKLTQVIQKLITTNQQIERQLGIDRKTRKAGSEDSLPEYIASLQQAAKEFLEQRLVKVTCPSCNVLVFRFAPVHHHTAFFVGVQCSQCGKLVTAERKERSVWFDLKSKDYRWRLEHPVRIYQQRKKKSQPIGEQEPIAEPVAESEVDDVDSETGVRQHVELATIDEPPPDDVIVI